MPDATPSSAAERQRRYRARRKHGAEALIQYNFHFFYIVDTIRTILSRNLTYRNISYQDMIDLLTVFFNKVL